MIAPPQNHNLIGFLIKQAVADGKVRSKYEYMLPTLYEFSIFLIQY